jgi:hypothetical protein
MICFFTVDGYGFTIGPLLRSTAGPRVSLIPYREALVKSTLPRATYIFTDIDRLNTRDLIDAARLYRRLQDNDCRVLNDPAQVRTRFSLLRGLHLSGLNPINAYSAEAGETPKRFPVFIRVADGHDPPLSDLISDQRELDRAIEAAVIAGIPRSTILIVEYAAEPVRPGIYRKLSVYRVGGRFVTDVIWHASSWKVKGDQQGLTDDDMYEEELKAVVENSYVSSVEKIFSFANIEYGRVDFSFVGGAPCVYEINTNPMILLPVWHPAPQRVEAMKIRWAGLLAGLRVIDSAPSGAADNVEVAGISVKAWERVQMVSDAVCAPHIQLSKEYARRGDAAAALRYAMAAQAANPNSSAVHSHIARILATQGRFEEAVPAAVRAVELSPRKAKLLRRLGSVLYQAKRYQEARDTMVNAIATGDESWRAYLVLSRSLLKLGENAAAVKAASRVAQLAVNRLIAKRFFA